MIKTILHALDGSIVCEVDSDPAFPLPKALALDGPGLTLRVFEPRPTAGLKAKLRGPVAVHYFEDATPRNIKVNYEGAIITERQSPA
jgi:hypothetical protein